MSDDPQNRWAWFVLAVLAFTIGYLNLMMPFEVVAGIVGSWVIGLWTGYTQGVQAAEYRQRQKEGPIR